jgi:predicted HTH transcriptional regulator
LLHLNLLTEEQPSKAAVLLFGKQPHRYIPSADINCLHFHGTEVVKPIPSQQVYDGTVFEMIDAAVDFIMSKLTRTVVPSTEKVASNVKYEIPYEVVREAIVNALAHRSYTSKAGVQVMLFSDRLEIWNPGALPEGLTVDQLRKPHHSIPRNRLLCEPLFLTHYIERAGTGTLDMISLCAKNGLPEPQFRSEGEHFVATIWRDWLTNDLLSGLGLNERQLKAVSYVRSKGEIANSTYQELTGVAKRTAHRDLVNLVEKGIFIKHGTTGKGVVYRIIIKGVMNGPKGS